MAKILKLRVKSGLKRGWLLLPATCLAALFAAGIAVWPQSPAAFNITLAGQSMIRSDFRVHTPTELATISPLLTGDVIFTNFEATVVEKGQSLHDGRFLSPPEALDALKALGFNLLALSDNHSFDLKVSGRSEHAARGKKPQHRSCRDRQQRGGSRRARLSAHAEGHGCAGGHGLGPDRGGRIGHRHSPGRERAAHRSRRQAKRIHDAAPSRTGERAERGRQAAHSSEHPGRAPACRPGDRVRTQSRLSEPPVRRRFSSKSCRNGWLPRTGSKNGRTKRSMPARISS